MFKQFVRFSHVGRRPIVLEPGVSIQINPFSGSSSAYHTTKMDRQVTLQGPLGEYKFGIFHGLDLQVLPGHNQGEQIVNVQLNKEVFSQLSSAKQKFVKSMWGTTAGILSRQADGVLEVKLLY